MKLSKLSLRDQIAIRALPGILARFDTRGPRMAARRAYASADKMLFHMDMRDHEIETLTRRAEKAEASVSSLLNMNEDGKFGVRVALSEIWEFLGVKNQTAAMQTLNFWRQIVELADPEVLK